MNDAGFFSDFIALMYTAAFLCAGYRIIDAIFPGKTGLAWAKRRLLLALAAGLMLMMWLPALWAFALGFTKQAQYAALGTAVVLIPFKRRKSADAPAGGRLSIKSIEAGGRLRELAPMLLALIPLLLIGIYLFCTHTIALVDGALHVGQSTYGDLSMHLGFVTSLSEQTHFPPQYSILPGAQIGYPFLCDSISASLYTLGASLRFSMLLPSFVAYFTVLLGVWCFFEEWLKKPSYTALATLLFFVGGGFGFAYHFDLIKDNPDNIRMIFEDFYRTPTNQPDLGLRWVNPITDMLVPQRATLFGWALLFPCMTLLRRAAFDDNDTRFRECLVLGVLAGALPMIHTHSFLALGLLSAGYFIRALFRRDTRRVKHMLLYAAVAVALAAPQLIAFTFRQSGDFLRLHFNWANQTDNFLWFYIKNMGLIFLMLPVAFLMSGRRDRAIYLGSIVIWTAAEFIVFQPNQYDNNKLLFVWFAFNCGLVAKALCSLYERLGKLRGKRLLAGMVCFALFCSGALTLGREAVSDYELISAGQVEAAQYIYENTEPDDIFLTSDNHNNAVAALTGRSIVCGSDTYLFFHGFDTSERHEDVEKMFSQPRQYFEGLSEKYNVKYVFISSYERYGYDLDTGYFDDSLEVCFENREVTIYKVS